MGFGFRSNSGGLGRRLLASTSRFSAGLETGEPIATLTKPFGEGTTFATVGTVPGQLALSGGGVVKGGSAATPGNEYELKIRASSGDGLREIAETFSFVAIAPDTTAPTLSGVTGTATGASTADLGVTTNEANGTLYWYVSASDTPPSAANLKSGSGAVDFGSQPVSVTGAQDAGAVGLSPDTAYFAYFLHRDAAGNDSAIAAAGSFLTEAEPDAPSVPDAFGPDDWSLGEVDAGDALSAPILTRVTGATTYPPEVDFTRPGDWMDGDYAVMQRSQDPLFVTGVSEATHAIYAETTSYAFGLTTIEDGIWYKRMAAWRGNRPSILNWSNIVSVGDVVSPVIEYDVVSMAERQPMEITITSDKLLSGVMLGGENGTALEVAGVFPSYTATVRLFGNADLDYEAQAAYSFTAIGVDLSGNPSDPVLIEEGVGDVDEIPTLGDEFTFTDVTEAAPSSTHNFSYTVAGLADGVAVPAAISSGTMTLNGGSAASSFPAVENGDVLAFSISASASYSTTASKTLNVGVRSDTASVSTEADSGGTPAFALVDAGTYVNDGGATSTWNFDDVPVGTAKSSRHLLVAIALFYNDVTAITINGVTATEIARVSGSDRSLIIYRGAIPTGTTADVAFSAVAANVGVMFATIEDVNAIPASVVTLAAGANDAVAGNHYGDPHAINVTIPEDGFGLIFHDLSMGNNVLPVSYGVSTYLGRRTMDGPAANMSQMAVSSAVTSGVAGLTLGDSLRQAVGVMFQP